MPDAEKIIARKIDKILGRNGFGSDYTQDELDGWGSEITAALRDAGMLVQGNEKLLQNYETGRKENRRD